MVVAIITSALSGTCAIFSKRYIEENSNTQSSAANPNTGEA